MKTKLPRPALCISTMLIFYLASMVLHAGEKKLKVEDVLAGHLEAIGPAAARSAITSRLASGTTEIILRMGGSGTISGKGQLLSEGRKFRLAYEFGQLDYPGEQIIFNGEKSEVGQIAPGKRSALSAFFYTCDVIPKEGLLSGVLSTAWPLFDIEGRQAKLSYSGLVKMDGKPLHEIRYQPKKGASDLRITLYFDPETFRHVRTKYRLIVAKAGVSADATAVDQDTTYTLTEIFDRFKEVDGLMLPQWTRLDLEIQAPNASIVTQWNFTVATIAHNQPVDPKSFAIRQ
jgi:hypothetical protein